MIRWSSGELLCLLYIDCILCSIRYWKLIKWSNDESLMIRGSLDDNDHMILRRAVGQAVPEDDANTAKSAWLVQVPLLEGFPRHHCHQLQDHCHQYQQNHSIQSHHSFDHDEMIWSVHHDHSVAGRDGAHIGWASGEYNHDGDGGDDDGGDS